jgi:hypothetical protein
MMRTFGGMAVFAVMIVILIGILQLVNWVPSAIQEGAYRRYRSVDEVRSHLKIDPIYQPVYYPRSVRWPPSLVAAQTRPYPAVIMEFLYRDREETVLTITQTAIPHAPLAEKLLLRSVRARTSFQLKGRPAMLESGLCRNDESCSRLTWDDGAFHLSLVMMESPVELVRMAESMVTAERPGTVPRP